MRRFGLRLAGVACALFVFTSCSLFTKATVGVKKLNPTLVHAQLNANAITGEQPSTLAREALHAFGLKERFRSDPDGALRVLHEAAVQDRDRSLIYALAELSYATAKNLESRAHYLAAAVYAYFYLFDLEDVEPPSAFDRRYRWACDIYNLGLELALVVHQGERLDVQGVPRELPVGTVDVVLDRSHFPWTEQEVQRLLPADDFDVFGLSLRYRASGLGVPLIGLPEKGHVPAGGAEKFVSPNRSVPGTAFLRLQGQLADLERGITAKLELYSGYDVPETNVGKHVVPLESDITTPLAYSLHTNTAIWEFSLTGFFGGRNVGKNSLRMLRSYERGKIPVVFVHGTASNPAYWAEMFNTLQADPRLRDTTQFWFFMYATGNPVAYSAATLRDQLREAIRAFDPKGEDPSLRHMVVIGHSQGGLLARLMVTDGDISWFKDLAGVPIEELKLAPKQDKIVRWALDFDPVPEVERVIFISTPHRGSFLAERWYSRFASSLIALPRDVIDIGDNLVTSSEKLPKGLRVKRVATSLENMDSKNPFLQKLTTQPIAPGVTAHSIIAHKQKDEIEKSDDGVVKYKSAHLDGVASECLVESGHTCQDKPATIREVRRILIEHLRAVRAEDPAAVGVSPP